MQEVRTFRQGNNVFIIVAKKKYLQKKRLWKHVVTAAKTAINNKGKYVLIITYGPFSKGSFRFNPGGKDSYDGLFSYFDSMTLSMGIVHLLMQRAVPKKLMERVVVNLTEILGKNKSYGRKKFGCVHINSNHCRTMSLRFWLTLFHELFHARIYINYPNIPKTKKERKRLIKAIDNYVHKMSAKQFSDEILKLRVKFQKNLRSFEGFK